MADNKAVFYYNCVATTGEVYRDLSFRVNQWKEALKDFLGPDYDVLVVPTVRRDSELVMLPRIYAPITPIETPSKTLLTETEQPTKKVPPKKEESESKTA